MGDGSSSGVENNERNTAQAEDGRVVDVEARAERVVARARAKEKINWAGLKPLMIPLYAAGSLVMGGLIVIKSQEQPKPLQQEVVKPQATEIQETNLEVTALVGNGIPDKNWTTNSIHVVNDIVKTTVPDIGINPAYFTDRSNRGWAPTNNSNKIVEVNNGSLFIVTDKVLEAGSDKPNYNITLYNTDSREWVWGKSYREVNVNPASLEVTSLGSLAKNPNDLTPGTENLAVVKVTGLGQWLNRTTNNSVNIRMESGQPGNSVPMPSIVEYRLQPTSAPAR